MQLLPTQSVPVWLLEKVGGVGLETVPRAVRRRQQQALDHKMIFRGAAKIYIFIALKFSSMMNWAFERILQFFSSKLWIVYYMKRLCMVRLVINWTMKNGSIIKERSNVRKIIRIIAIQCIENWIGTILKI